MGTQIFEMGHTLVSNGAYDAAIRGYDYLITKGKDNQFYVPAKIELINAKELKITSGKYTHDDLLDLEKDYMDAFDRVWQWQLIPLLLRSAWPGCRHLSCTNLRCAKIAGRHYQYPRPRPAIACLM